MGLVRQLVGIAFGAAGLGGLLLCLAGLAGVWAGHRVANGYVDRVSGRAEGALTGARGDLRSAADRLRQTEVELEAVRRRETGPSPELPRPPAARRALSRKAVEAAGPGLGEARDLVTRATETALVANGLLDALGDLDVLDRVDVDTGRLKEASAQAGELADRMAGLADLLARAAPPTDEEVARESSVAVDGLRRTVALAEAGVDRLETGRQQVADSRARVRRWLNRAAVIVTVVLVWIGAGQLSLLAHARRLIGRRRRGPDGPAGGGANPNVEGATR